MLWNLELYFSASPSVQGEPTEDETAQIYLPPECTKELKCAWMLHTVHFAPRVLFTFMSLSVSVMHLFLFRETK